jgi:hypothetical protein
MGYHLRKVTRRCRKSSQPRLCCHVTPRAADNGGGILGWCTVMDFSNRRPAPSRVVINAVGRVSDHKVRRDATEHALNVGRHCAVAAEQAMAAEHPATAIQK